MIRRLSLLLVFFCFAIIFGCSGEVENESENVNTVGQEDKLDQENNGNKEETIDKTKEVTLTFMTDYPEDRLNEEWLDPWKEKFPNVTIKQIAVQSVNREAVEEMVAKGIYPDIAFFHNSAGIEIFEDYEMTYDLQELIEKTGFDMNVFNQGNLDVMYGYNEGKILALPLTGMSWVTYYNKDIFDMFGVPYPEDNMTWNEMIDLARQVTQERDGIQYRGLDIGGEPWTLLQWSEGYTDPETDEPIFAKSEGYLKTYSMYKELFSIPGNYPKDPGALNGFWIPFATQQNIAMVVSNEDTRGVHGVEGFEHDSWDIVTWPQFEERLGYKPSAGGNYMGINRLSEHKEIIFDMITYLVSDEHQTMLAKKGYVPVVESSSVLAEFGADIGFGDKNIEAIFSLDFAPPAPPRSSGADFNLPHLGSVVDKGIQRLLLEDVDVQTVLREMQEEAEGMIADAKGSS